MNGLWLALFLVAGIHFIWPLKWPWQLLQVFGYFGALAYLLMVHRRSHVELRASEERFRRIFQDAFFGMTIVGEGGNFIGANSAFCKLVGYSLAEIKEMHINDVTHPDD